MGVAWLWLGYPGESWADWLIWDGLGRPEVGWVFGVGWGGLAWGRLGWAELAWVHSGWAGITWGSAVVIWAGPGCPCLVEGDRGGLVWLGLT